MPIAKETSAPSNPIPAGMHHAVCYGVIDLGTQQPLPGSLYNKVSRKVLLQFEVPDERIELERDGKIVSLPRATSKEFTLSLHEKAGLRAFLVAWRGKQFTAEELQGFDVCDVLGANCMLNIVHNDKGYAHIASIGPLVKGLARKQPENPLARFEITDTAIPGSLPEWIRKKIEASDEWRARKSAAPGPNPDDFSDPFPPADGEDDNMPF